MRLSNSHRISSAIKSHLSIVRYQASVKLLRENKQITNDNAQLPIGNECADLSEPIPTDESALVTQVGNGDATAFSTLVERHSSASYRVAFRMLGDQAEAEDVVQECFSRLWTHAPNWAAKGAGLAGWLHRVTMNLCLDRLRKKAPLIANAFPEVEDTARRPDERLADIEASRAIDGAMAGLPTHYRSAIILSYYEELSNAAAAEVMEMQIKAFESILFRARRQLRRILEMQGYAPSDFEVLA